jgi:ElaB/YqjD/DUF883 family membrane-anchored ribosome-binding protein
MATASFEPGKRTSNPSDPTSTPTATSTSTGSATRSQFQESAHGAMERVEGAAHSVAEQGRQAAENIREVTDTFANAIEESLDKRPMTTLAMAVAVGFFLGALWQR